jgi:hypothetical protein
VVDSSKTPATAAPDTQFETIDAERALFEGRVHGLVAVITPGERPLQGLAGSLDWRFQGAISRCLENGFLTGQTGECAYVPLTRAGTTYHLLLVGSNERGPVPQDSIKALKKNIASLKLSRLGISRGDWNAASDDFFSKNLKGVGVCILR